MNLENGWFFGQLNALDKHSGNIKIYDQQDGGPEHEQVDFFDWKASNLGRFDYLGWSSLASVRID